MIGLDPVLGPFLAIFFEKFCIALFLGKILVANYRIVCEVNFAPKAQNFSTDIRKSAFLDAVLEDKPAQPLPCGSYLVILIHVLSLHEEQCSLPLLQDMDRLTN